MQNLTSYQGRAASAQIRVHPSATLRPSTLSYHIIIIEYRWCSSYGGGGCVPPIRTHTLTQYRLLYSVGCVFVWFLRARIYSVCGLFFPNKHTLIRHTHSQTNTHKLTRNLFRGFLVMKFLSLEHTKHPVCHRQTTSLTHRSITLSHIQLSFTQRDLQ